MGLNKLSIKVVIFSLFITIFISLIFSTVPPYFDHLYNWVNKYTKRSKKLKENYKVINYVGIKVGGDIDPLNLFIVVSIKIIILLSIFLLVKWLMGLDIIFKFPKGRYYLIN
tara:strand:+ start:116 stop:451 length:336 start_codon:yes stop_codon:yes gene_type:complete